MANGESVCSDDAEELASMGTLGGKRIGSGFDAIGMCGCVEDDGGAIGNCSDGAGDDCIGKRGAGTVGAGASISDIGDRGGDDKVQRGDGPY